MANASEAKVARVCRRLLRKLWRLQVSGILQPHGSSRSVTRRYAVAFDWSPMGSAEMYLEFLCTFSTVLFRLYLEIVCVAGLTRCTGVSSGGATSIYRTVSTRPSHCSFDRAQLQHSKCLKYQQKSSHILWFKPPEKGPVGSCTW
jgi:hypothetical protein